MHKLKGGKPQGPRDEKLSYEAFHDIRRLSAADPLAGAVIHDRYELIGKIGSGGMARIYLAMDKTACQRVAVKIISENPERMDEMTERFIVEAKAAGMINHPNIIEIKDIGTYKDRIFCVMEYLEGFALSAMLEKKQGMPWERAKRILAQVCDALEAAHQKGVIHRDMKPENVMIVPQDGGEIAKVLDFGLARITDNKERLTQDNMVLGTPSYMAPEQAWSSEYDHRVDIYAVGIIAYEMACGTPPFVSAIPDEKARALQILLMHKETAPKSLRETLAGQGIPECAERAIMRAIMKNPSDRFASAREMKEALLGEGDSRLVKGSGLQAAACAAEERAGRPFGEERWRLPEEEETIGRIIVRAAKKALALGAIAAAIGIPAFFYRNEIRGMFEGAATDVRMESAPEPAQEKQAAPVQTAYSVRVESSPRGASVTDISGGDERGRVLGVTPLDLTFQNYENVLLVERPGYYSKRIVVTRSQPEWKVSLRRIARRGEPQQDGGGTDSEPAGNQ